MTTQLHEPESLESCTNSAVQIPKLRLVSDWTNKVRESDGLIADLALPCAVLKSTIAENTPIVLSALTDLFKRLRQGERIEFVHRISRSDPGKVTDSHPYRLAVKVACLTGQEEKFKGKVLEALLTAFPGFHLGVCAEDPDCSEDTLVPHVLQFAPSGVVIEAKPANTRFDNKVIQSSPALGCLFDDGRDKVKHVWPFPGKLANWALTAPLYESLELPETVEINVRLHGFSINEVECEALHKTLFRVLSAYSRPIWTRIPRQTGH